MNEQESKINGIRAALEALSDDDYLAALPARCLGCGSAALPCHCEAGEPASATPRQVLLQRLEAARAEGQTEIVTTIEAELATLGA